MIADPNNYGVYWSGGDHLSDSVYVMAVSKSTDYGANWIRYDLATGAGITNTLAIDPANSNVLYAGGDENSSVAVYKTTNAGTSWSKLPSTGLSGTSVYSLSIDPDNTNVIYAGTSNGCYKSTDAGTSWSNTGCPGGQVNAVLVNRGSSVYEGVYVGTETNGAYLSTDDGSSWAQINEGLTDLQINCLGLSQATYIYAGTQNGGIHRWSIQIGAEEQNKLTSPHTILHIIPNPTRNNATISYEITTQSKVNLRIYDTQGRLIKELINQEQAPGTYSIRWNGANLHAQQQSAGIYFTRLTINNTTYTKKFILID